MTSTVFEEVIDLVESMKAEYARLTEELPKLRETKKVVSQELSGLNKELVAAQEKLEQVLADIKLQTTVYGDWQASEIAKLRASELEFDVSKSKTEAILKEREDKLRLEQDNLDFSVGNHTRYVNEYSNKTEKEQASLQATKSFNEDWSRRLDAKESEQKQREEKMIAESVKNKALRGELDQEAKNLEDVRVKLSEALKLADGKQKTASQVLAGARERIASIEARELATGQRSIALSTRSELLDKREAALNDRRDVMIANGTL